MTAGEKMFYPIRMIFDRKFNPNYKRRLAEYVASLCEDGSRILDVGCDDGSVAKMIMELNPTLNIIGIDIQSFRPPKIQRKVYDGRNIPYPDNSFDAVIVLDVLHHTQDILLLLKEIRRVSRKYVIIKDHMTYGTFSNYMVSFADYISNAPYGIKCAFNFPSFQRWKSYFNQLGLEIVDMPKNLRFGPGITERYHPIFKLEKRE
jgi:ubiquinone/menaquinone biosynthesis C-methylase UbiE